MIILNKKSTTGADLIWTGEVVGSTIIISHGQVGGKIQKNEKTVTKRKNIGKKNESSEEEQALQQLETTARRKIEGGYSLSNGYKFTTINEKQVKKQDSSVPVAMSAHPYNNHVKKIEGKTWFLQAKMDGCLSGDTLVELERNGVKTLKEVVENKIFDKIKSFDLKTKKITYENILAHGKNIDLDENIEWFMITLEDGTKIKATGNHPFFIKDLNAFRRCDELKVGDFLFKNNK